MQYLLQVEVHNILISVIAIWFKISIAIIESFFPSTVITSTLSHQIIESERDA